MTKYLGLTVEDDAVVDEDYGLEEGDCHHEEGRGSATVLVLILVFVWHNEFHCLFE